MGGLALGSWWAARLTRGSRQLLLWYALAEAAVGLYALVFHEAFVRLVDFAFTGLLPGMASVVLAQLAKWSLALVLIMPPTILLGTTFPLMAEGLIRRRPRERGRLLGLLYFSNTFPTERARARSIFGRIPDLERRKSYRWMAVRSRYGARTASSSIAIQRPMP